MKKIISILLLFLVIITPAVVHADAATSAANAVAALLQNKGLSVSGSNTNAQSMSACVATPDCYNGLVAIAQQYNVTIDGVSGTSALKSVPADSSSGTLKTNNTPAKMPNMFYIPKSSQGFTIEKIPEDILDNSNLSGWLWGISVTLMLFGFVYNMYMNLYRLSVGAESKNKTYWQLFAQFIFAFIALYIWSKGIFFIEFLQDIDAMQNYIWTTMTTASDVVGIETTVNHMITTMGIGGKGSGFEWYNPWTWNKLTSLAGRLIFEFIFSIILFIVYIIYVAIYFIIYLFQILILALLYAIFPIAVGLWVGEYSESVKPLQSWFKWFIEVASWGIVIGLENVIFNTTVGDYLSNAGLMNAGPVGIGFSLIVAVGLVITMLALLLAGPFLIHKIFGMTSGHGYATNSMNKVKNSKDSSDTKQNQKTIQEGLKAMATGGASIPADMAKEGAKQAASSVQEGSAGGGIAPGAPTKLND